MWWSDGILSPEWNLFVCFYPNFSVLCSDRQASCVCMLALWMNAVNFSVSFPGHHICFGPVAVLKLFVFNNLGMRLNLRQYKNVCHVATFSHCAKLTPKYPGYKQVPTSACHQGAIETFRLNHNRVFQNCFELLRLMNVKVMCQKGYKLVLISRQIGDLYVTCT